MSGVLEGWDQACAMAEGWFIYRYDPICISATVPGPFCSDHWTYCRGEIDNRALAFVQQRAREGSAYHIEALARTQLL